MATMWTDAVVVGRTAATPDIAVLDLAPADGADFPEYTAGAHIDVLLDGPGLVRQYSLCGTPGSGRYRLAVLKTANSRGGSDAIHALQVGDTVRISPPRNRFPLAPARRHLMFAGGIGITPLLAMAKALDADGGDYVLHYCARSRDTAAFVSDLAENPRVSFHFGDGNQSEVFDIGALLGAPSPDAAVYVCGPAGFMNHVLTRAEALGWPPNALHKELFSANASETESGDPAGFTVRLASTGVEYRVPKGASVLDVLLDNGVDAPWSCQQGICGECVVRVVSGEPHHLDDVLSDEERAEGLFTTCTSRAHTPVLEIDL